MTASRCPCGAESLWGSLATAADVAAWQAEHAGCAPAEPTLTETRIRCATEDEAVEVARDLRRLFSVGRVGACLLVKRRAA